MFTPQNDGNPLSDQNHTDPVRNNTTTIVNTVPPRTGSGHVGLSRPRNTKTFEATVLLSR